MNPLQQSTNPTVGQDAILSVMALSTGGTIEKVYREHDGSLRNRRSPFRRIIARLRRPSVKIRHKTVMQKDSLDMTDDDRRIIGDAIEDAEAHHDAILVVHGTDTLSVTGEYLHERFNPPPRPIILTGAMRPFEFRDTDAFQNIHESLIACRLCPPGVFVVMHSKVLRFPGVVKDRRRLTFVIERAAQEAD